MYTHIHHHQQARALNTSCAVKKRNGQRQQPRDRDLFLGDRACSCLPLSTAHLPLLWSVLSCVCQRQTFIINPNRVTDIPTWYRGSLVTGIHGPLFSTSCWFYFLGTRVLSSFMNFNLEVNPLPLMIFLWPLCPPGPLFPLHLFVCPVQLWLHDCCIPWQLLQGLQHLCLLFTSVICCNIETLQIGSPTLPPPHYFFYTIPRIRRLRRCDV